ncbi:MAG: hypothetical protein COZ16_13100 [Flavobacteriaceae bacterium CG_4_10_14_3_um_filter_31_253]|nr:MAG: hypothetical protein COW43_09480 [Flavobacteriaceae bacterium CG17_big_fil_post_rev_8_21_14_2_50_31_13]PIX11535.1 MAG: hypothetical protein COZ74_13845 [Flavobacteriaceae bacterium CG_4_8_14_3_um_filter_31_8]PIY13680.1 MAG: hypothetical protein COZ16_13100 [Flavobacteriaceae bacterium CG_4_10_14_3_um_filter_31_253]PIZ10523.1 MAG: hypothetical protein COY55_08210 [Flavobacteriaceae bacterium CG_4_10_14_0_8_um_filter_31_99]PJC10472.1 MAG: hypothetical protein CO067_04460 [Flavobacteriacea
MILDQMIFNKSASRGSFEEDKKSERPMRSIVKAFTWRLVGTLDTLIVSFFVTQKLSLAASIASVDFMTKIVLYFFHERVWNTVKWGK